MEELVSSITRRAFQESYVEFAVLRQIKSDFEDAGLTLQEIPANLRVSGERRSLVEGYYTGVNWSSRDDVRRVLTAYEVHLFRLREDRHDDAKGEHHRLVALLEEDGLSYDSRRINLPLTSNVDYNIVDQSLSVDVSQLQLNIARIRAAVETDPALAIGGSKELVEACCKAVLAEMGEEIRHKDDIPQLIKKAANSLDLLPENIPERKKGVESIRRILGSLGNIVHGIAELRNTYGSGHGRAPGESGLLPRHARLCAGAASTLSMFLIETTRAKRDSET